VRPCRCCASSVCSYDRLQRCLRGGRPAAGGTLTYKKSSHARLAHAQLLNIYFVITFYIYIAATDQEQPSLTALQAQILDQRAWKRLGGARTRGREPADDPPSPRITRAEASRESQESSHRLSREDAQDLRETRTQRAGWTAGRRTRHEHRSGDGLRRWTRARRLRRRAMPVPQSTRAMPLYSSAQDIPPRAGLAGRGLKAWPTPSRGLCRWTRARGLRRCARTHTRALGLRRRALMLKSATPMCIQEVKVREANNLFLRGLRPRIFRWA
jgi:hypothetical protein